MNDSIIQLYPSPAIEHKNEPQFYTEGTDKRPLHALYLNHNIRRHAVHCPFVYANFVSSVDGRIAIPHPAEAGLTVPKEIANARDWRLFQELAAQADLMISSGRYLREWADGRGQEILQSDDPRFADLRQWRMERGLKPQPDIAIISQSLNFPIPSILTEGGRKLLIITSANADKKRMEEMAKAGHLLIAGDESVDGIEMVKQMADLGYHAIYSAAGPKILALLLESGVLNRLYITQVPKLLGGRPFASIVEGRSFSKAVTLSLYALYFDQGGDGQLFASYTVKE